MVIRIALLLFLLGSSLAADSLRVGVAEGFPPYQYAAGGKPVGLDVDLTEAIVKEAGMSLVWDQGPWDDKVALLRVSRELDLVTGMEMTGDRPQLFRFSQVLYTRRIMVFTLESGPSLGSLEDLAGLTVTGDRDAYLEQVLEEKGIKDSVRLVRTSSKDEAFRQLVSGKVSAAIMPESVGWYLASKAAVKVRALDFGAPGSPVALAFTPGEGDLAATLDRAIDRLKASGVVRRILDRYGPLLR